MTEGTSEPKQTGGQQPPLGWPIWRLSIVIIFGAFASGLDASLVHVAIESIRVDLDSSLEATQWVSNVYLLALAVSLPLAGWAGERFGAGRIWLLSLAAFTLTSVLCALSGNLVLLIAMRALQGLAGGILIPAGQAVLGQAVGAEKLGRVIASLGIVVTLAPALGPVVGGFMLNWLSWPWLFAINLPIGVVGLILGAIYVPKGEKTPSKRIDLKGIALLSTALPLGVFSLTGLASSNGNTITIPVVSLSLSLILGYGYLLHSKRTVHPAVRVALLRNPQFSAAIIAACFTGMLIFGSGLVFPLYFQVMHDYSTIETGLRLLSFGGGTALALPFCGSLVDKLGAVPVAVFGATASLASALFLIMSSSPDVNMPYVQTMLFVYGASIAFAATPPTIAAYKAVESEDLPQATMQVNIVQRLGGALGGAIFAIVLSRGLQTSAELGFRWSFIAIAISTLLALAASLNMWRTRNS